MKPWLQRAQGLLTSSLTPPKQECNELDWKLTLSENKGRLSEHLSAFSNHAGGGCLVFGISSNSSLVGVDIESIEKIINQLTNLGRDAVEPSISLDHEGSLYDGVNLLFVHVPESPYKPIHVRGRADNASFIRSGGTTRRASRQEIGSMMLHGKTPRWEDLKATVLLTEDEVLERLDADSIFDLLEKPHLPSGVEKLKWMHEASLIEMSPSGGAYITNLGAITAALELPAFAELAHKPARVVVYDGLNKSSNLRSNTEGRRGYAITFANLIKWVEKQLPMSEVIEQALRRKVTLYPTLALREIIANALIHQDFTISGAGPLIEIFNDRIEISNPGRLLPSKTLDRIIGTQPESRNEKLAKSFRLYGICEQLGSGLVKAGLQIELYGLPPIKFEQEANHFKVSLFAPRTFAQMTSSERLNACYQHAVLRYLSSSTMTNKSLRERLKMPEKQRSMVSVLIQEAIDKHLIAPSNPLNKSRKLSEYVPFWAAKQLG
jgi:ATP-dependent DNA helicase RecG